MTRFVCGGIIARKLFIYPKLLTACLLLMLGDVHVHAETAEIPQLVTDSSIATAGYYRLQWNLPAIEESGGDQHAPREFELQESTDSQFSTVVTLYKGPDLATVLSGRSDGERYYRVRVVHHNGSNGRWSETVSVETQHHPLSRALGFFITGAIVFVLTLALVVRGSNDEALIDTNRGQ